MVLIKFQTETLLLQLRANPNVQKFKHLMRKCKQKFQKHSKAKKVILNFGNEWENAELTSLISRERSILWFFNDKSHVKDDYSTEGTYPGKVEKHEPYSQLINQTPKYRNYIHQLHKDNSKLLRHDNPTT